MVVINYVKERARSIKTIPGEWLFKQTKDFKKNLELQKLYCKKFNTDYAIMGDVNKYIKVIHFTGPGKTIHEHKDNFIRENWK